MRQVSVGPSVPAASGGAARFLLCGVAAPPVLVSFVIAATVLTPGHSHVSDHISALGAHGSSHAAVMNAGFAVHALLLMGLAYGLYRRLGTGRGAKAGWGLLAVSGVGTALSAIFRDDLSAPNPATSLEGTLHAVSAQVALFAFLIAVLVFAVVVRRSPEWRGFAPLSVIVVVLNLALFVPFLVGGVTSIEGALQRSLFGLSLLWLTAVSLRALWLAGALRATVPQLDRGQHRNVE